LAPSGKLNGNWRNIPGSHHGNRGQWSFADGHAAVVKWLMPTTQNLKRRPGATDPSVTTKPFDLDLQQVFVATYPANLW
jgi:prepilin-type processing-associated H-X9-DG protein